MDASGVVYAAHDTPIDRFSQAGAYLGSFTTIHMTRASGLAFDSSGNLYAADSNTTPCSALLPMAVLLKVLRADCVTPSVLFSMGKAIRWSPTGQRAAFSASHQLGSTCNRMLVFAADGSLLSGYGSLGATKAVLLPMPSAVPEPASAVLPSLGICFGMAMLRRRKAAGGSPLGHQPHTRCKYRSTLAHCSLW